MPLQKCTIFNNLYIYFLKPDRHSVSPDRANVREEKTNDTLQCQRSVLVSAEWFLVWCVETMDLKIELNSVYGPAIGGLQRNSELIPVFNGSLDDPKSHLSF